MRGASRLVAASGVASEFLDGTMEPAERDRILRAFEAGSVKVLTSCDIVSEGFDVPAIEGGDTAAPHAVAVALPAAGRPRALRTFPGKAEAIILDHVGAVVTRPTRRRPRVVARRRESPAEEKPEDEEDDEQAIDSVRTCPKCFTVPACAVVPDVRIHLPDTGPQAADGRRRAAGVDGRPALTRCGGRGARCKKAQTRGDLIAQGIHPKRADIILQAREAKQRQVDAVLAALDAIKAATGRGPYAATGHAGRHSENEAEGVDRPA